MIYTDALGNKYRKESGVWKTIKKGVGWVNVKTMAFIPVTGEDGSKGLIGPEKSSEEAQQRVDKKAHENQLFIDLAISHQQEAYKVAAFSIGGDHEAVASYCCDAAQAMIDELKKRGRL